MDTEIRFQYVLQLRCSSAERYTNPRPVMGGFSLLACRGLKPRDDMMRMAGSLTLGTIRASVLIRSLLSSDRPSGLTQAIIEAGKINKTLYLLNYIDDEDSQRSHNYRTVD